MHDLGIVAQSFQPSQQQWMLIGIIVVVLLIVFLLRSRKRPRDGSPGQYRREIETANRRTTQIHQELESLLTELENASGKITSRIEEEFSRLNRTISEADRRISALRILMEASRQLSDRQPQQSPRSAQAPAATLVDPRHARIYSLADEGLTCQEIARRLNENPGEVELILNLRPSRM